MSGGVNRTLQSKLSEIFSVKDFGAVGDGITIDTTAIQTAFNTGNDIYLPAGTYRTTGTISITNSNQTVWGAGNSTVIAPDAGTYNIIQIGTSAAETINNTVKDFTVYPTSAMTDGAAIKLVRASRLQLANIKCGSLDRYLANGTRFYDGLDVAGVAWGNILVSNCDFIGGTHYGIQMSSGDNNGSEIQFTDNCTVRNDWQRAIYIGGGCGGVDFDSIDVVESVTGLWVDDARAGIVNRELLSTSMFTIDTCTSIGAYFGPNSIVYSRMTGTWFGGNDGEQILIVSGQPSTSYFVFDGCHVDGGNKEGFKISDGAVRISNCVITNNGRDNATGGHGIHFTPSFNDGAIVSDNIIERNGITTAGSAHPSVGNGVYIQTSARNVQVDNNIISFNARYAVQVDAGCSATTITNNNIFSNVAGSILHNRGINFTNKVSNNLGYITEQAGTATIVSGANSVTVSHNLAGINNVQVTPFQASQADFYATNLTGSSFDIVINASAGADRNFFWLARIM